MLFDLLATDVYVSYNINLANILGLQPAIYVSELINIHRKAVEKKKLENNQFRVDRKYITKRTTITLEDQKSIDSKLNEINLITCTPDSDLISINYDMLTSLLLNKDEKIVEDVVKPIKKKRTTRQETILSNLKLNILTTNEELQEAYSDWIDTIFFKQGWLSKKAIIDAQRVVDENANSDLDVALKIIEIADKNGYRDMSWAVNKYMSEFAVKKQKKTNMVKNTCIKLSDEVI